jgi:hypothetical protein
VGTRVRGALDGTAEGIGDGLVVGLCVITTGALERGAVVAGAAETGAMVMATGAAVGARVSVGNGLGSGAVGALVGVGAMGALDTGATVAGAVVEPGAAEVGVPVGARVGSGEVDRVCSRKEAQNRPNGLQTTVHTSREEDFVVGVMEEVSADDSPRTRTELLTS